MAMAESEKKSFEFEIKTLILQIQRNIQIACNKTEK